MFMMMVMMIICRMIIKVMNDFHRHQSIHVPFHSYENYSDIKNKINKTLIKHKILQLYEWEKFD